MFLHLSPLVYFVLVYGLLFLNQISTVNTVVIDTAIFGTLAGPIALGLGSYGTFGFNKLISFLEHKPRNQKVIHMQPLEDSSGRVTVQKIAEYSRPFKYDYINGPLPHKPLMPKRLKNPLDVGKKKKVKVYKYKAIKLHHHITPSAVKFYNKLPPVVAPPYLPLPLIYSTRHKFTSRYW